MRFSHRAYRRNNNGIVIIGAGGHGREMCGVLRAANLQFSGFLDDSIPDSQLLARIGAEYLGPIAEYEERADKATYLIGIGSGTTRQAIANNLSGHWAALPVTHPTAALDLDVRMQRGAVVCAQATVTTNIDLGRHTHIGRGAAVGHDSSLGDFVTVMPLASVSGSVIVETLATIGTGAVVRQGQTIGAGATVGAGAVVVSDVGPGETVVGNPARAIKRGGYTSNR